MFNWEDLNGKSSENGFMKSFDTLQKARTDLIGEWDAILQYDEHIANANNNLAKATWEDIRNEELVHVGELMGLLFYLAPYQKKFIQQGLEEFERRSNKNE